MIKDIMQPYPFSLGYTNIYSLSVIVVNKDDSVTVNLFNIAETEEEVVRHSLTIHTRHIA